MDRSPPGCCCGPFRIRFIPPGLLRPTLLRLLRERPSTGFDLMKEIARRTEGVWAPGPAAIYPALKELLQRGYIERTGGENGRSLPYRLTPQGQECIQDWERTRDQGGRELKALEELWGRI